MNGPLTKKTTKDSSDFIKEQILDCLQEVQFCLTLDFDLIRKKFTDSTIGTFV